MVSHGAVDRVARRLLEADVRFGRDELLPIARRIAAEEDPLNAAATAVAVVDTLVGLGPLESLLADESVSDVLVNGPNEIWVERSGRLVRTDVGFLDGSAIAAAVERVVAPLGLRLDHASPIVDARLPDGSRLHAVLSPVAVDGPIVAIRRFTNAVESLQGMLDQEAITAAQLDVLQAGVSSRNNILVCGGTGAGKTTLLNLLSAAIPDGERVVTIEDAAELSLRGHVVRLETRPANADGAGAVTTQQLVRHALRLRPDRIIVGEVRGPEALDMIQAMATGHDGSMSTVHAGDAAEALWRLEILAMSGESGMAPVAVRGLLLSTIDTVVVMARVHDRRIVRSISTVSDQGLEAIA